MATRGGDMATSVVATRSGARGCRRGAPGAVRRKTRVVRRLITLAPRRARDTSLCRKRTPDCSRGETDVWSAFLFSHSARRVFLHDAPDDQVDDPREIRPTEGGDQIAR